MCIRLESSLQKQKYLKRDESDSYENFADIFEYVLIQFLYFDTDFTKVRSQGFVVLNGCNAIILNIEVSFKQHIYAPPGFNEFSDPFYLHDLTLITAWISKHMPSKLLGEITYPFMKCNGCADEV